MNMRRRRRRRKKMMRRLKRTIKSPTRTRLTSIVQAAPLTVRMSSRMPQWWQNQVSVMCVLG